MRRGIFVLVFLIFLIGIVSGQTFEGETQSPVFEGSRGGEFSGSYVSSNPQYGSPGYTGVGFDYSEHREVCRERQDFVIQVAPGGCSPGVVRSDLLAEQDVPVFCQLQATMINPTIEAERIRGMRLTTQGQSPEGVAGISYYPPKVALRPNSRSQGFPSIDNVGYAVIVLNQNPDESSMPEFVSGNLTARIDYDVPYGTGLGLTEKVMPVLSDEEWQLRYKEFAFMDGKGYLRVEGITSDSVRIGVYTDVNRRYDSFVVRRGGSSGESYLPGFYCNAAYSVRVRDVVGPRTKAVIEIDNNEFEGYRGSKFEDGLNCRVLNVESGGAGTGSVSLSCNGKRVELSLERKDVQLEVEGVVGEFSVGDKVIEDHDIYLGYNGVTREGESFVVLVETDNLGKVQKEVNGFGEEVSGINDLSLVQSQVGEEYNAVVLFEGSSGEVFGVGVGGSVVLEDNYVSQDFQLNFDEAVDTYRFVKSDYGDYEYERDLIYGKKALDDAIKLSSETGQSLTLDELYGEYIESYGSYAGNELSVARNFDTSNAVASIKVDGYTHNIRLKEIREPDVEDSSVEFVLNNEVITLDKEDEYLISPTDSEDGDIIQMREFGEDYVWLVGDCEGDEDNFSERVGLGRSVSVCGNDVFVRDINFRQEAVIRVDPVNKHVGSTVNISYSVGIEQRAIQLSPEKSVARIERLNQSIEQWNNINEGLGKVVEGMKAACFATSAALQVKNLLGGLAGEAIARQEVMRGEDGWNQLCSEAMANDGVTTERLENLGLKPGTYQSLDDCFRQNAEAINSDVNFYTDLIQEHDGNIKSREEAAGAVVESGLFGSSVDTQRALSSHLREVKQRYSEEGELRVADAKGVEKSINVGEVVESLNEDFVNVNDVTKVELLLRVRNSDANERLKTMAEKELYGELERLQEYARISEGSLADEVIRAAGLPVSQIGIHSQGRTTDFGVELPSAVYSGSKLNSEWKGLESNTPVEIVVLNGERYIVSLQDYGGTNPQQKFAIDRVFDDGGIEVTNEVKEQITDAYGSYFVKLDGSSYSNPYQNPEVRYHEKEPYKGMPALVPLDVRDGWYAGTRPTIPAFGEIKAFQDSGMVASFWLCNVGANGREEFEGGLGDDICQQFNVNTGQALDIFPGLPQGEARLLVDQARKAIEESASQYGSGVRRISILGRNYNVGNPASSAPGTSCTDFMSPGDCQILFNTCDPVICPSSRCNLGGKYYVDDVVQTGIVGGVFMCLPNAKEGIAIPVCLTGVHAGVDNFVSILEASRDCLQENVESGRYVGICDEITAIYQCEFFWRQVSPLMNTILPKLLESVTGGGVRGGGEYASVSAAWGNMQNSIDFFKNEYSVNALKAFNARSTEEAGTQICKGFVSLKYANEFKTLIEPDSPAQFSAWFDEIPQTDATVPARSQYKVYYHIFAGNDRGAYYSVYLKNSPGTSFFQESGRFIVNTGYIGKGEYVDEARDFVAASGFQELCVRVNEQEECGFQKVTTSFALNYLADKYVEEQATNTQITSEGQCVSGTPSALPLVNPNLQSGVEEAVNPQIYARGIIRICATDNPGLNTEPDRWQDVGYCGEQKIRCWIDRESVSNAITDGHVGAVDKTLEELDQAVFNEVVSDKITLWDNTRVATELFKEIRDAEGEERLKLIRDAYEKYILSDVQQAEIEYLRAGAFDAIAWDEYLEVGLSKLDGDILDDIESGRVGEEEVVEEEEEKEGEEEELAEEVIEFSPYFNVQLPNGRILTSNEGDEFQGTTLIQLAEDSARDFNVNPILIFSIIRQESNWDDAATSPDGARGLMQVLPSTANSIKDGECRAYCPDARDYDYRTPRGSLYYGTCYLKCIYDNQVKRNVDLTLAAYNWGIGNVQNNCADSFNSCRNVPSETANYVPGVKGYYERYSDSLSVSA